MLVIRRILLNSSNIYNVRQFSQRIPLPLRPIKGKSTRAETQHFVDSRYVRAIGGKGGDGCISFLQLWVNDRAGPDGGDGGSGGHVIFEASLDVNSFNNVKNLIKADNGENGRTKDCHGKNAKHTVIKVPVGTIIKTNQGIVVGDLSKEKFMFVAARGGCGGRGNHFFISDTQQSPQISEYGASGEDVSYQLELRSMAHIGFIGLPNAGKSTLLRAISRAKPKVAPYAFTTLRPHIGIVQYDDYEQIAIADLPGLIEDSHKNKGLGIQFLKHAERCAALLFLLDASTEKPWEHYEILENELKQFSEELLQRPKIIVANKIDLPEALENLEQLKQHLNLPIIGISAKLGTNLTSLLQNIRTVYDDCVSKQQDQQNEEFVG